MGDLRELAVSLRHADARLLAVFNLQKVSIRQYHHLQLLRNRIIPLLEIICVPNRLSNKRSDTIYN